MNLFAYFGAVASFLVIAVPIFSGYYDDLTEPELANLISENAFVCINLVMNLLTLLLLTLLLMLFLLLVLLMSLSLLLLVNCSHIGTDFIVIHIALGVSLAADVNKTSNFMAS